MATPSLRVYPILYLPLFPKLDFGLCARVFSAVFTHLEPTIDFSHSSAVSHPKPRDFRLHEPAFPFHTWSAVSPTGNDMTLSSGHVIALDQSEASIRSQMSATYYFRRSLYQNFDIRDFLDEILNLVWVSLYSSLGICDKGTSLNLYAFFVRIQPSTLSSGSCHNTDVLIVSFWLLACLYSKPQNKPPCPQNLSCLNKSLTLAASRLLDIMQQTPRGSLVNLDIG